MKIYETRVKRNIEYARRWLNRATKDFDLFKKLVPFDKRTKKPTRCSDPALAVYLLQQSVEKAVKAAAIASGQYKARDFIRYYRHNSLALIINLNNKIVKKIEAMGLSFLTTLMGVDLVEGEAKLSRLEKQIMGLAPLLDKDGKEVDFKCESISLPPEVIDQILDKSILNRRLILDTIRTTFSILPDMGIHKGKGVVEDAEEFIKVLSERVTDALKFKPPTEEQLKAPIEFIKHMSNLGFESVDELKRTDMITNYLSVWAFSYALLLLTYLTFTYENTSRYPLKQKGDIKSGKIGCDDYDENLGIVNRIGKIGYATSLTLNEMDNEIENLALFLLWSKVDRNVGNYIRMLR